MRIALGVLLLTLPVIVGAAKRPELPEIGYPLAEIKPKQLRSQFTDRRRGHQHQAIDLMRPRGTPVMAVADGEIRKLYRSKTGGISIYLFDDSQEYCFFYGHLDHYAKNLHEGQEVHKGEVIGYVGYTGNAKRSSPHLHFAVSLTGLARRWSGGIAIDPYPILLAAAPATPGVGETKIASGDTEPK
jgi:murein DD-endopeptidase MepM/ murein hydrolase activator NlpD